MISLCRTFWDGCAAVKRGVRFEIAVSAKKFSSLPRATLQKRGNHVVCSCVLGAKSFHKICCPTRVSGEFSFASARTCLEFLKGITGGGLFFEKGNVSSEREREDV